MAKKGKSKLIKYYVLAVIILLVFLYYFKILNKVESNFLNIFSSLQSNSYTFLTKLKYSFINYQEAQDLKKDNEELKSQYNKLLYENSQLNNLIIENQKLRALLNFYEEKNLPYVVAKVIGKEVTKDNTLIINKGKNNGIDIGYPVVIDQGLIIGQIVKANENISLVLLLTDNQSQLAVSTINSNKTTGLAKGEFGLSIKVDLIPQDLEIQQDDLMITSGLEMNIPRGLIIGKVNRIISNENDLFKSVTISPLVDYNEITLLSVIIPKDYLDD